MFLSLKTLYRKRTVIWPFYFYTIIRTLSKDRDEYISEMSENSSSVVRAYTQAEYDNVDLLSTLDTKI